MEQKVLHLENAVNEKDGLIHQLELALEKKYLEITELEGRCGDLNEKLVKEKAGTKELEDCAKTAMA
jgi:hypothetical protein